MGGGTSGEIIPPSKFQGLSPRGRGKRKYQVATDWYIRSIPAWAGDPQTAASSPLTDNVGADDCRQARPDDDSLDHPRPFHGVSDMPAPVGSHSPGPIDQVSDRSGIPRRSPAFPGRGSSGSAGCPERRS